MYECGRSVVVVVVVVVVIALVSVLPGGGGGLLPGCVVSHSCNPPIDKAAGRSPNAEAATTIVTWMRRFSRLIIYVHTTIVPGSCPPPYILHPSTPNSTGL
eukprot:Filipodium_phascolosomae@DN7439_c0_g1_i1.p1